MLITRETDYALRVLRALVDADQLTAGDIAMGHQVPPQFVYKIIKKLERVGMVKISRGAGGGCRLSADLSRITLYDLMETMGENRNVISCMEPGHNCPWRQAHGDCTVHCQLAKVQKRLDQELQAHTLESLISGDS